MKKTTRLVTLILTGFLYAGWMTGCEQAVEEDEPSTHNHHNNDHSHGSPEDGDHGHGDHDHGDHDHGDHDHNHGSHDHDGHDHDGHSHSVKAPESVGDALGLLHTALAGVSAPEAAGLDDAAYQAESSLAAAVIYLKENPGTASDGAEKDRLLGSLDNLNIIGKKLHDAAHDGKVEKVASIAEQLKGVIGSVKKYYPER